MTKIHTIRDILEDLYSLKNHILKENDYIALKESRLTAYHAIMLNLVRIGYVGEEAIYSRRV